MTGIAEEDTRGSLYEFTAADGTRVNLHEADCRSVTFRPALAHIELLFVAGPPAPHTARFSCHGAEVLAWDHEAGTPAEYAGQVRNLSWYDGNRFELDLTAETIIFTAAHVDITTR